MFFILIIGKFLHIIKDSPVYPVVLDSKNTVCSLPPIINGDHSKIKVSTRNIFIECTATEELKASTVLNMVVSMFSQYCQEKFSVEQVEVIYEADGSRKIYPDLSTRTMTAKTSYINSCIGDVKLSNDQIQKYLARMYVYFIFYFYI